MKVVLYIVVGIVALGGLGFIFASMGLGDIKKMIINEVDLSKVADGVYTGEFRKIRWNYKVEVTIKDHRITAVKPVSKKPDASIQVVAGGAEKAMIGKQSVIIDVVSGATVNTKAFQKAVENALTSGVKK